MSKYQDFKRLIIYVLPYKKKVFFAIVLLILGSALAITPPLLIQQLVDRVIPDEDMYLFALLVLGIFLVPLLTALIQFGQYYFSTVVGYKIMLNLRNKIYRKLLKLPIGFFDKKSSGEIISRLLGDTKSIESLVGSIVFPGIQIITSIFLLIPVALYLSWQLTIIGLVMYPLTILPSNIIVKKLRNVQKKIRERNDDLTSFLNETIPGVKTIKAFLCENKESNTFHNKNKKIVKLSIKGNVLTWLNSIILNNMVQGMTSAIVYSFGVWTIIFGDFTIGGLIAFAAYLPRLYAGITQLTRLNAGIQGQMVSLERLDEYEKLSPEKYEGKQIDEVNEIKFKNVYFQYDSDKDKEILRDLTFTVSSKQFIALVGPSGAGKTTIIDLIMGYYLPKKGNVYFNNIDLNELSRKNIRRHIGFVSQDLYLFNRTVKENICYGIEKVKDTKIIEAAKAANIHSRILELPDKYNTYIGERGNRLSGGERQRIAIARALLKQPDILILDEATSDLDSLTEKAIQLAIESLKGDCITISIAHRLSTILNADNIYVIDNGKIVEEGNHEQLITKKGLYNQLYKTQFSK